MSQGISATGTCIPKQADGKTREAESNVLRLPDLVKPAERVNEMQE